MQRLVRIVLANGLALLAVAAYGAELQASVDRTTVRQNESFEYKLSLSGDNDSEPNFDVFNVCCEILSRHHNTRVQILNGDYQRLNEWQLQLMARATGPMTVPPVRVGNVTSNPIIMMVLAAADGGAAGDVFLEVASVPMHPYVQAETVYTLRLHVGVDARGQRLSEPVVTGGEAIIEKLGDDRRFQTERGGRSYTVIERRYSIFPQQTGNLTVEPLVFEAQVVASGTRSNVQRYRSDAIELMVKPVQAPPLSHPDAVWLPARRLSLQDEWSSDSSAAGIPITRQLTIRADGLLNTQVPAVALGDADGVRQYSDQPELSNWVTDEGIQGRRIENIAVIAGNAGEFDVPGIELPWFDVTQAAWQIARVPEQRLSVSPSREQQAANSVAARTQEGDFSPVVSRAEPSVWRLLSLALGAGWLLTILAWVFKRSRQSSRAKSVVIGDGPSPRSQQRRLLRGLRRACEAGEASRASELLLSWGQLRFETAPPRSLTSLAGRLGGELATAIVELEQHLYGRGVSDWDGNPLLVALKQIDTVNQRHQESSSDDALLPLYR
ncbi:MAG: BatD family protein [Gammaproteobacteria bacterium]